MVWLTAKSSQGRRIPQNGRKNLPKRLTATCPVPEPSTDLAVNPWAIRISPRVIRITSRKPQSLRGSIFVRIATGTIHVGAKIMKSHSALSSRWLHVYVELPVTIHPAAKVIALVVRACGYQTVAPIDTKAPPL